MEPTLNSFSTCTKPSISPCSCENLGHLVSFLLFQPSTCPRVTFIECSKKVSWLSESRLTFVKSSPKAGSPKAFKKQVLYYFSTSRRTFAETFATKYIVCRGSFFLEKVRAFRGTLFPYDDHHNHQHQYDHLPKITCSCKYVRPKLVDKGERHCCLWVD